MYKDFKMNEMNEIFDNIDRFPPNWQFTSKKRDLHHYRFNV